MRLTGFYPQQHDTKSIPLGLKTRSALAVASHQAPLHNQGQQQQQRSPSRLQATLTASNPHSASPNAIIHKDEFRRGVGLCIVNKEGLVFAAKRMDDRQNTWQMPQGGIDIGENPRIAALRELHEETGIVSARIVSSIDKWLDYEFPTKVRHHLSGPWFKFRGQTQKWFLVEFHGQDDEVDLSCHGTPEFSEFQWMPLEEIPQCVVEFKQGVYREVARHFAPRISAMRRRTAGF